VGRNESIQLFLSRMSDVFAFDEDSSAPTLSLTPSPALHTHIHPRHPPYHNKSIYLYLQSNHIVFLCTCIFPRLRPAPCRTADSNPPTSSSPSISPRLALSFPPPPSRPAQARRQVLQSQELPHLLLRMKHPILTLGVHQPLRVFVHSLLR
jgi:hypothetical protein